MNDGIELMKCIEQSPVLSSAMILAFIIFAMGFAMTLVAILKTQWGHQAGEAKYITSGALMILIGIIIIILV